MIPGDAALALLNQIYLMSKIINENMNQPKESECVEKIDPSFVLGAGLSYCCVYIVPGRRKTPAGIIKVPCHYLMPAAGMKSHVGAL